MSVSLNPLSDICDGIDEYLDIFPKCGPALVDLSAFYHMKQQHVAALLGMAVSTFSKRWRKASSGKQWPYRRILLVEQAMRASRNTETYQVLAQERESLLRIPAKIYI